MKCFIPDKILDKEGLHPSSVKQISVTVLHFFLYVRMFYTSRGHTSGHVWRIKLFFYGLKKCKNKKLIKTGKEWIKLPPAGSNNVKEETH